MVDAKKQQFRSSPSGPIGGRKSSGTIGGKGFTIGKNASNSIAITTTQIPDIAGVKPTDFVVVQPAGSDFFPDGNTGIVGAACDSSDHILVRILNPTGVDVTDWTCLVEVLIIPFNIA